MSLKYSTETTVALLECLACGNNLNTVVIDNDHLPSAEEIKDARAALDTFTRMGIYKPCDEVRTGMAAYDQRMRGDAGMYSHPWISTGLDSARLVKCFGSGLKDKFELIHNSSDNTYSAFYYLTNEETWQVTTFDFDLGDNTDLSDLSACQAACDSWIKNGYNHKSLSNSDIVDSDQSWWKSPDYAKLMETE